MNMSSNGNYGNYAMLRSLHSAFFMFSVLFLKSFLSVMSVWTLNSFARVSLRLPAHLSLL